MRFTRVLSALAVGSLAAAGTARADFKDFSNRCSSGALVACASLQVFTTLNASGGTDVVILVRNLQGGPSYLGDNTGGSLIARIGIVAPPVGGIVGGLSVNAVGGATLLGTGDPSVYWQLKQPGGLGGAIELTAGITPSSTQGGIVGCHYANISPNGWPDPGYQTCNGGWVEFRFSTTTAWSANNADLAWLSSNYVNTPNGITGLECSSDPATTGPGREYCGMVTPEPITMILLGSGLAGMGGFGLTRRRKGLDIENG